MPELPEVEVAKKDLQKVLVGKVIRQVTGDVVKMVSPALPEFYKKVKDRKIKKIDRRAKVLIFVLEGENCLVLHFKLTGQLVYQEPNKPLLMAGHPMENIKAVPNKFTHITFTFSDGTKLYFNDLRKFAYIKLFPTCEIDKITEEKFGIEPLTKEFSLQAFVKILKSRPKAKIKQFLMDQELIAGIGNIYSDEILFYGRVRPTRRIKTLKNNEISLLYKGIKKILSDAVARGSTSYNSYVNEKEMETNYNPFLKAYQREGEKCVRNDGGAIKRLKIGGRSAHYCPVCQK